MGTVQPKDRFCKVSDVTCHLWKDGISCAFEYIDSGSWVPIGWARINQLIEEISTNADGPVWWCHLAGYDQNVPEWIEKATWLQPEIRMALKDDCRVVSDRMKHLLYEVPVSVFGGLMFELLGISVGDVDMRGEKDVPVVVRAWHDHNYLITVLHVKGTPRRPNVMGIIEVKELLYVGGNNVPRSVHEVIALLANRLAQWDDRSSRRFVFGEADKVELKFLNRRPTEDLELFSQILDREIKMLSQEVILVKWSLHARDEIVRELLRYLRGDATKALLEDIRVTTREMLGDQEAVRSRIFTVQEVMQSRTRTYLQDKSSRVTHNLAVLGAVGVLLSLFTGLFGINLDGMPGTKESPYAFAVFTAVISVTGIIFVALGFAYFGFKKPTSERQLAKRQLELEELVKVFQWRSSTHALNLHRRI